MQMRISNVCACVHLNKPTPLSTILCHFPDACHVGNNRKFKSIKLKIQLYKGTAMISSNGKIVLVGCESLSEAEEFALFLFSTLEGNSPPSFAISNIVCTAYTPFKIRLDVFQKFLVNKGKNATYEPEIDAPCVNIKRPNGIVKMYRTGNMIIAGSKTQSDVLNIFESVVTDLKEYASINKLKV